MKVLFTALFVLCIIHSMAQNTGIGISSPLSKLHVASSDSNVLLINNTQTLNTDVNTGLFYKTGSYYSGSIRSVGYGLNVARLGFYTFASGLATDLKERMSILDNGFVGINTTTPTTQFEVNGQIKINGGSPGAGKVLTTNTNSGLATWENPVSFSTNTGFSVLSFNTLTIANTFSGIIPFVNTANTYGADDGSNFNNVSHAYIVPSTGLYQFNISYSINPVTAVSNGDIAVTVNKNGFYYNTPFIEIYSVTGQPMQKTSTGSFILKCTAGDAITVNAQNSSGSTITINTTPNTSFSGVRLY